MIKSNIEIKKENGEWPVFIISHLSRGQLEELHTTVAHSPNHTHIHTPVTEDRELVCGCGVLLTDASAVWYRWHSGLEPGTFGFGADHATT